MAPRIGAVFGELSVLLDQPHAAECGRWKPRNFYVADGVTLLRVDPIALLYVATVLAQQRRGETRRRC
jgi:hypothetical protein